MPIPPYPNFHLLAQKHAKQIDNYWDEVMCPRCMEHTRVKNKLEFWYCVECDQKEKPDDYSTHESRQAIDKKHKIIVRNIAHGKK